VHPSRAEREQKKAERQREFSGKKRGTKYSLPDFNELGSPNRSDSKWEGKNKRKVSGEITLDVIYNLNGG